MVISETEDSKKAPCPWWGCAGFSWDRVNFYKKPGGDTASWLTQTGQTKGVFDISDVMLRYSIPCAVMLGLDGGSWPGGG